MGIRLKVFDLIAEAEIHYDKYQDPVLSVSPQSNQVMYVSLDDEEVVLSQNAFSISAYLHRKERPSIDALIDFIIGNGVLSVHSGIDGILRIPPGYRCVLRSPLTIERFWPDLRPLQKQTYADLLSCVDEILSLVFREQVSGRNTFCELSGGIDSSLMTCYAKQSGAFGTYYHRRQLGTLADELTFALEMAQQQRVKLQEEDGSRDWVLKNMSSCPRHSEPNTGALFHEAKFHDVKVAASLGAEIYLSGVGGDELFTAHPFHVLDLFKQLKIHAAYRSAFQASRRNSLFNFLEDFVVNPYRWYLPPKGLGNGNQVKFRWIPVWVEQTFIDRYRLRHRVRLTRQFSFYQDYLFYFRYSDDQRFWQSQYCCRPFDLALITPFLDQRLWDLIASSDPMLWMCNGHFKPILKDLLMRFESPPSVYSHGKGDYSDVVVRGLERESGFIHSLLNESLTIPLGIANKNSINQLVHRTLLGHLDDWGDLAKWLSLELWLRQFDRAFMDCFTHGV